MISTFFSFEPSPSQKQCLNKTAALALRRSTIKDCCDSCGIVRAETLESILSSPFSLVDALYRPVGVARDHSGDLGSWAHTACDDHERLGRVSSKLMAREALVRQFRGRQHVRRVRKVSSSGCGRGEVNTALKNSSLLNAGGHRFVCSFHVRRFEIAWATCPFTGCLKCPPVHCH